MRKIFTIIFLVGVCIILSEINTYALSNEFAFLLETMEIEKININGLKINEEIYNEYQLLVYGSPYVMYSGQRWKNVDNGHWSKNKGPWNGEGIRGEYWILGENYYGKEVHNHLFPVDIEPPSAPTEWRYAIIPDALESWQDIEKYMDDIQKNYMLTQNLTRNNNSYNLNVLDIGLDKVRVENYATWKTKGTVYTQRYDQNNKRWAANFLIPPMAANANLESFAIFPNGIEYVIKQEENSIKIPITYGACVQNLTDYARKEHVKNIRSQLFINGVLIDEYYEEEKLEIEKSFDFIWNKTENNRNVVITIPVEIRSTLITKFTTEGPLVNNKAYMIYIYFGDELPLKEEDKYNNVIDENYNNYKEIPAPEILEIKIQRIENGKENDLLIAKKTEKQFICAGQAITIQVKTANNPEKVSLQFEGDSSINTLDYLTQRFEWDEPRLRGEKSYFSSLKKLNQMYDGKISLEKNYQNDEYAIFNSTYIIPYGTKQTLHSWNTLRELNGNAFEFNENKLFMRIKKPYEIVIKAIGPTGADTKRVELDVFERWDTLYNRDLSKYVEK